MFVNSAPDSMNVPRQPDEKPAEGLYFIIDWVKNNPLQPGQGHPVVVAGNVTEENMVSLKDGKITIETPRFGTKQRVLLQVIKVENIE